MRPGISRSCLERPGFSGPFEYRLPLGACPADPLEREGGSRIRCGYGKCYGNNGWCGCGSFQAQPGDTWWCTCGHRFEEHGS